MPAVVSSVAELGIGDFDAQMKIIGYGAQERQSMYWYAAAGLWMSDPRPTLRLKTDTMMGMGTTPGTWMYLNMPFPPAGTIARSGYGWTPQAIHRPVEAWAAGLRLWEKLDYLFWTWANPNVMDLATVFFELNPNDVMSTNMSAEAPNHLGTVIRADVGSRKYHTTGWVASGIPAPTKGILAPHLYFKGVESVSPTSLEYLSASWRWVGDPTP